MDALDSLGYIGREISIHHAELGTYKAEDGIYRLFYSNKSLEFTSKNPLGIPNLTQLATLYAGHFGSKRTQKSTMILPLSSNDPDQHALLQKSKELLQRSLREAIVGSWRFGKTEGKKEIHELNWSKLSIESLEDAEPCACCGEK